MKNTRKWLVLLLAAVLLLNSVSITAMAAKNESPLGLYVSPADEGTVSADILTSKAQVVADGKLVVTYDPAVLTYEKVEIGGAWSDARQVTLSVNSKIPGKVILAFANATAAKEGVLFSVKFSGAVTDTGITVDGDSSYITGVDKINDLTVSYCPSAQFVDIKNAHPMIHEAVDYMVGMGYMNGMSTTHFGPANNLNRGMMVTILHRIAGSPEASGTNDFVDVPDDVFYTEPVQWALNTGITTGIDSTHFAPVKDLTRQELVTFLYRFAKYMEFDVTATTDLSGYTDANKVQPFATDAFEWAVASGVVNGTSATTLSPEATTTRAQICIMIQRMLTAQD